MLLTVGKSSVQNPRCVFFNHVLKASSATAFLATLYLSSWSDRPVAARTRDVAGQFVDIGA